MNHATYNMIYYSLIWQELLPELLKYVKTTFWDLPLDKLDNTVGSARYEAWHVPDSYSTFIDSVQPTTFNKTDSHSLCFKTSMNTLSVRLP